MSDTDPISHYELDAALQAAAASSDAAECHGVLCGMICAAGTVAASGWQEHLLGEGNTLSAAARDCQALLDRLYAETLLHLNDGDLALVLLLPDDAASLMVRSEALAHWCQGFLFGLGLSGMRQEGDPPGSATEVMKDFSEISKVCHDFREANEGDEEAYMEIVEYVRMSVLLLHEEMQSVPTSKRLQ